jgi:hypothetical protein
MCCGSKWHNIWAVGIVLSPGLAVGQESSMLEGAFRTCISRDMSLEAKLEYFRADDWQFIRDTNFVREFLVLQREFMNSGWMLRPNWRGYAEDLHNRLSKILDDTSKPFSTVARQTERYGEQFLSDAVLNDMGRPAEILLDQGSETSLLALNIREKADGTAGVDCVFMPIRKRSLKSCIRHLQAWWTTKKCFAQLAQATVLKEQFKSAFSRCQ